MKVGSLEKVTSNTAWSSVATTAMYK